jgi:hypothetical protein
MPDATRALDFYEGSEEEESKVQSHVRHLEIES